MKLVITCIVMCVIWLPYQMSSYSKNSSWMQDYGIAFIGFGISALIYKLIEGRKKG